MIKKQLLPFSQQGRKEVFYVEYGVTPKGSCTTSSFKRFEGYQTHS